MAADSKLVVLLKLDGTDLGKGITRAQADVAKLGTTFTALGLAAGAAVKFAADFQDGMIKAARSAGTTAAEFSKLAYAAGLSGVSTEQLGKSMNKLNKPTVEMSSAMQQMGVSMRDSSGQLKNQDLLLADVADGISKLKDPTSKATAATMIFGEEGVKMVSMLEGGSKGLRAAAKEAEEFGQTVSQTAGENAEKFNDNISKVTMGLTGFRNVVSESAIDLINQSAAMETVQGYLKDAIAWWRGLSDETKSTALKVIAATVAFGGLLLVFTAIAAAAPAIAAGFTLMLGPVGLIVMGIAALTAALLSYESESDKLVNSSKGLTAAVESQNKVFETAGANYRELEGRSANYQSNNADVRRSVQELEKITSKYNVSLTDQSGNYRSLATVMAEVNAQRIKEAQNILVGLTLSLGQMGAQVAKAEKDLKELSDYNPVKGMVAERVEQMKKEYADLIKVAKGAAATLTELNAPVSVPKAKGGGKVSAEIPVPPEIAFKSDIISAIVAVDTVKKVSFETNALARANEVKKIKEAEAAEYSKSQQTIIAYAKVAEAIAKTASQIIAPFSQLTDTIAKGIEYDSQVAMRDLDVVANRAEESYNAAKEALEASEQAKIDALEKSYDDQIDAVQRGEDAKTAAAEAAANARLLAADEEYKKQLDLLNANFAAQQEADRANYEAKMSELDARALDKEQRQLTETIMEEDQRLFMEMRENEHQKALADLAKGFADKQKGIDSDLKATQKANADTNKSEIEALTNAKNLALTSAEEDKNAKLKALDIARAAEEKSIEKQRLQTQYNAQVDAFNSTKAVKIAETVASGLAAAAQAFAALAPIPFVGIGLGAAAAGIISGAMAMRVGQISSQAPIKPAGLLEDGGFIGGTGTHANGGDYNAKVESGEFYLDRGRTSKMLKAIDSGLGAGGGGIQITFQAGAIQGDIRDERTMNILAVRLGNLIQRQMVMA